MPTSDKYTNTRIKTLHPAIQDDSTDFINECEKRGMYVRMCQNPYRTFEMQDYKYASGRTRKGKILTNAKGGDSFHNYKLAEDVVEIKNGQPLWVNPNWELIGEIGKKFGFEWGGDFKSLKGDDGHFQKTFGYSISDLKKMYAEQGAPDIIDLKIITHSNNEKTV